MRFVEMVDLADMLGRMGELEVDALAHAGIAGVKYDRHARLRKFDANISWAARTVHICAKPIQSFGRCRDAREVGQADGKVYSRGARMALRSREVTRGQIYPSSEVDQYLKDPGADDDPGITEEEALRTVEEAVDTSDVMRSGEGTGVVYAYGYRCCQDRLKVGFTEGNTVQRIAAQITTSTPDKPVLLIEIKTNQCRALEVVAG